MVHPFDNKKIKYSSVRNALEMSGASSAEQEDVLGRPERVLAHVAPVGHEHVRGHHWPRSVSADEASVAGPGAERLAVLPRVNKLVERHEPYRPQRRRLLQTQLDGDARARRHEALARIRSARSGAAIKNLFHKRVGGFLCQVLPPGAVGQ
jgi:hypothetical protein